MSGSRGKNSAKNKQNKVITKSKSTVSLRSSAVETRRMKKVKKEDCP